MPATNNQLDSWHGLKQLERSLQHVAEGDKRNHGRTWHSNLDDKPHAIRVHASYCGGDAAKFRISFINAMNHPIKGNHSGCPDASCCKIATAADNPSEKPILSERLEQMPREAMEKSHVYKNANLCVENVSTALVESFITTLNVIHHP